MKFRLAFKMLSVCGIPKEFSCFLFKFLKNVEQSTNWLLKGPFLLKKKALNPTSAHFIAEETETQVS